MPANLTSMRETLVRGIKLSMQGSYARRSPARHAVQYLEDARRGLRQLVEEDPKNVAAWRLLSQAEECLLDYQQAIECLERAMQLSKSRSKGDLKRLALLKDSLAEWQEFVLSPEQLRDLGEFLVAAGASEESKGRTLKFTRQWLNAHRFENVEAVLQSLGKRGAHTDFQILYNVVRG